MGILLCKLNLHKWRMTKKYLIWKCEKCGEEKEEDYHH